MSLKKNILNLFFANSMKYVVPLLQFPYITRVLGVDEFGLFVFSFSVITFLRIITNFGFDLYLPKEIIENKYETKQTNKILTQTIFARFFLFCIATIILFIIYFYTEYYKGRENLLFIILVAVFFNSFSLTWFYQSKEMIYIYSRITVAVNFISLGLVFLFVKTQNDLHILLWLTAFTSISVFIIAHFIARVKFNISLEKVKFVDVKNMLKKSFEYFISRVGVSIYATLGGFVIGAFSGDLKQVAYYGAAHQLYSAGIYAFGAICTPLLPYMVRTKNYKIFFKITILSLILTAFGSAIGLIFGKEILGFIYGDEIIFAKDALNIFMITAFASVLGMLFGYPALVPLGKARIANLSVIYAGVAQLCMIAIMYFMNLPFNAVSIAITYLFCDLIMMSCRIFVFTKIYGGIR